MARLGKNLTLIVIFALSILLIIAPVNAQVENVPTSCQIFPNIVEGQPVSVAFQIYPAPPSGEVFNNLFVWVDDPKAGVYNNGGNGPWGKDYISTDTNGRANVTLDVTAFSGYFQVGVYFEGQDFASNTLRYQGGNWQTGWIGVSPAKTPDAAFTPTPTPTIPEFSITLSMIAVLVTVSLLLVIGKKRPTSKLYNIPNSQVSVWLEWVSISQYA